MHVLGLRPMMPMADGDGLMEDMASGEFRSFELLDDAPAREWPGSTRINLESVWGLKFGTVGLLAVFALAVLVFWAAGIKHSGFPQLGEPTPEDRGPQEVYAASTTERPRPNVGTSTSISRDALTAVGMRGAVGSNTSSTREVGNRIDIGSTTIVTRTETSTSTANAATPTTTFAHCSKSPLDRFSDCKAVVEVQVFRCMEWPLERKAPAPQISKALYINLDRDTRRRKWMEAQLETLQQNLSESARLQGLQRNFTIERISALDIHQAPTDPRFQRIRERGFNLVPYPVVDGRWSIAGCTFSHLTILWKLREHAAGLIARNEVWLVLEDDATVGSEIERTWQHLWPWLPMEWDIVRLGWFGGSECSARVNEHIDLALWKDDPPQGPCYYCGSHAYIVNPASIERVIHRLESSRIMHVDCLLGARTPPMEDSKVLPPLLAFATRPSISTPNYNFPTDRIDN